MLISVVCSQSYICSLEYCIMTIISKVILMDFEPILNLHYNFDGFRTYFGFQAACVCSSRQIYILNILKLQIIVIVKTFWDAMLIMEALTIVIYLLMQAILGYKFSKTTQFIHRMEIEADYIGLLLIASAGFYRYLHKSHVGCSQNQSYVLIIYCDQEAKRISNLFFLHAKHYLSLILIFYK